MRKKIRKKVIYEKHKLHNCTNKTVKFTQSSTGPTAEICAFQNTEEYMLMGHSMSNHPEKIEI